MVGIASKTAGIATKMVGIATKIVGITAKIVCITYKMVVIATKTGWYCYQNTVGAQNHYTVYSTSGGLLQDGDDGLASQPGEDQGEDNQEDLLDTQRQPTCSKNKQQKL